MTVERSKRRCFLTLIFIVKSVSKNLLIRTLEHVWENQLAGVNKLAIVLDVLLLI